MRFVDQYLPRNVPGYPCFSSPRFSTDLTVVDSGAESANARWENPLHKFTLPEAVRDMETFNAVRNHWMVMRGPFQLWPWRDPLDFASVELQRPNEQPPITDNDEALGVGDGLTTQFQLYRTYRAGSHSVRRKIELPIVSSVVVGFIPPSDDPGYVLPAWTVTRPGGLVVFAAPVAADVTLSAGFLFDVCVRFESDDSFDGIVKSFGVAGFSDLTLIETRVC